MNLVKQIMDPQGILRLLKSVSWPVGRLHLVIFRAAGTTVLYMSPHESEINQKRMVKTPYGQL